MRIVKQEQRLSNIIDNIGELNILKELFGITDVPVIINSPFREDNKPSFGFYYSHNNKIRYKDFGTGENGNIYELIKKLINQNSILMDKIKSVLSNNIGMDTSNGSRVKPYVVSKTTGTRKDIIKDMSNNMSPLKSSIEYIEKRWSISHIKYFDDFGIDIIRLISMWDVAPVSYFKINNQNWIPANDISFVYKNKNNTNVKIYQPFSKKLKWLNTNPIDSIDLIDCVPNTGDELFITSSRKDAMCLWSQFDIPAISFQTEMLANNQKVYQKINELKKKFKKVKLVLDNDKVGIKMSQILMKDLDIEAYFTQYYKDPSDSFYYNQKIILQKLW